MSIVTQESDDGVLSVGVWPQLVSKLVDVSLFQIIQFQTLLVRRLGRNNVVVVIVVAGVRVTVSDQRRYLLGKKKLRLNSKIQQIFTFQINTFTRSQNQSLYIKFLKLRDYTISFNLFKTFQILVLYNLLSVSL